MTSSHTSRLFVSELTGHPDTCFISHTGVHEYGYHGKTERAQQTTASRYKSIINLHWSRLMERYVISL